MGKLSAKFSISRDHGKLEVSSLEGMSLMKSYVLQQDARFIAFIISELLIENQQASSVKLNFFTCYI